jgi:hypothetical protein
MMMVQVMKKVLQMRENIKIAQRRLEIRVAKKAVLVLNMKKLNSLLAANLMRSNYKM